MFRAEIAVQCIWRLSIGQSMADAGYDALT